MTTLTEILQRLISEGADPNELQDEFEKAVSDMLDWVLWGDGHWRENMVCSKCGSSYAGICSDDPNTKITDFENPTFHKNQEGVARITYKEWLRRQKGSV